MIKLIEMRTAVQTLLKTAHSRVYYQKAPDDATMPYVVFDFPNSVDSGALENFVLDVDAWDDDTDTTTLETLIDTVDAVLHKKTILVTDKVGIVFYRENRLSPSDDDPRIRRRKYIYQARTYQKYY
jgi:hypothetical protein